MNFQKNRNQAFWFRENIFFVLPKLLIIPYPTCQLFSHKFLKPFDISRCWAKSLTFWTKQHTYSRMSHYKFHSIHENEEIKANGLKVIKLHHGWAECAFCFKMALAFMMVWVFIAFCENWELLHIIKTCALLDVKI